MSVAPFMQLYVADYLGDTRHLTTEQHGAYLLILMAMWRAGGALPNDESKIARIAGLSAARWRRTGEDVMAFFTAEGGTITQKRLAIEIEKAKEKSEKRAIAGAAGGTAKALKSKETAVANATILPEHSSDIRHQSKKEEDTSLRDGAPAPRLVSDRKPETPEARLYREGKSVLGKSAGGVLTKLRKACEYDDDYAMSLIEQAAEKENPMEWMQAVLRAHDPDRQIYDGAINYQPRAMPEGVPTLKTKEEREYERFEEDLYRTLL